MLSNVFTSGSKPSIRSQRARRIRDEEWDLWRQELVRLYVKDDFSRKEIVEMMARDHNFEITERQLRLRFERWDIKKNIDENDMTAMLSLRKSRLAIGKDVRFQYRGHDVEQERLERAYKRRKAPLRSPTVLPTHIKAVMSPQQASLTSPTFGFIGYPGAGTGAKTATFSSAQPVANRQNRQPVPSCSFYNYLEPEDGQNNFDTCNMAMETCSDTFHPMLDFGAVPFTLPIGTDQPELNTQGTQITHRTAGDGLTLWQDGSVHGSPLTQATTESSQLVSEAWMQFLNMSPVQQEPAEPSTVLRPADTVSEIRGERFSVSPLQLDNDDGHDEFGPRLLGPRYPVSRNYVPIKGVNTNVDPEAVTLVLLLFKDVIFQSNDRQFQCCNIVGSFLSRRLSVEELDWLCLEFDNLLCSSHEASIRTIRKRQALAREQTSAFCNRHKFPDTGQDGEWLKFFEPYVQAKDALRDIQAGNVSRCGLSNGFGRFEIRVRHTPLAMNSEQSRFVVELGFIPQSTSTTLGLQVRFLKLMQGLEEPRISPHITTFNMIPSDSKIIQYVYRNDLEGVHRLFDRREASPFDVDMDGYSLLHYAVFTGYSPLLQMLMRSGASLSRCGINGRPSSFIARLWDTFVYHTSAASYVYGPTVPCYNVKGLDQCIMMTQLALDADCDIDDESTEGNGLPGVLFTIACHPVDEAHFGSLISVVDYLLKIGCDLEKQNCIGETPLLFAAGELLPHIIKYIKALLHRGANMHVADNYDRGALHCALSVQQLFPGWGLGNCLAGQMSEKEIWDAATAKYTEEDSHADDYGERPFLSELYQCSPEPIARLSEGKLCDTGSTLPVSFHNEMASSSATFEYNEFSMGKIPSASSMDIPTVDEPELDYVLAEDGRGVSYLVRDPVKVLKKRLRFKLLILLEAGCDPNAVDFEDKTPSDYARKGVWPEWIWALTRSGYLCDDEGRVTKMGVVTN